MLRQLPEAIYFRQHHVIGFISQLATPLNIRSCWWQIKKYNINIEQGHGQPDIERERPLPRIKPSDPNPPVYDSIALFYMLLFVNILLHNVL